MNSVGIDLHRKRSHVAAFDRDGMQMFSRRVANEPDALLELLAEAGECRIAVEATYGWEWLVELLEDEGHDVHLAHPSRTRAIAAARVKTDAVDARTLAQLLAVNLLPEAYIAPRDVRDLRDLLRHRVALTQLRTAVKNRVHGLLARQGVQHNHSDLWTKGGVRFLEQLELREPPRRRLESLTRLIEAFDQEIAEVSAEINAKAKSDERVRLLRRIHGVGPYTAMLVIAEVGEIERFPSARHLCSWAGLTPTVRSSDGRARLGHISRQGSVYLRWVLVEAAQHTQVRGGPLRESYERIAKRRGTKIAKVAIARRILTLCYYGLRDGEIRALDQASAKAAA
jgi:transposase